MCREYSQYRKSLQPAEFAGILDLMRSHCAVWCLAALACHAADNVQPLAPFIESVFPSGGARGSEVQLSIRGRHLDGATALRVSGTGVTAHLVRSTASEVQARVRIASSADPGRRDIRVYTPQGTFVQVFEVGTLPEQAEGEPNDDASRAPQLAMPVVINGRVTAGDYDHFRFHANAGDTLLFDLQSSRLGTRFDAVLWVLDAEGREVAFSDDSYFDKDPRVLFTAPVTGDYTLRLSGFREGGTPAASYRLLAGPISYMDTVFPAGGRRGIAVDVDISGANLDRLIALELVGLRADIAIVATTPSKVRARITPPAGAEPGVYTLRARGAANGLPFVVSDLREQIVSDRDTRVDGVLPTVMNGTLRAAQQKDTFHIQVSEGERWTFQGDAMMLGNFLDPAVTIFDESGNVVAYMDEAAPNGFDKEPTTVDFRLVHKFQKPGKYRVEVRDAALRGHDTFIYRFLIGKTQPRFEVYAQTNQVSVVAGQQAIVPVRVRRYGGWAAPVEVWLEGLPARVESKRMTAEPVDTRFRGTFSEDFFFDGTNVELPLQVHAGARPGATAIEVRAKGTFEGHTMEAKAPVHYPWQQTGYMRGPANDQQLVLTVAPLPLFELEAPATATLKSGSTVEIAVTIRWLVDGASRAGLKLEASWLPQGVQVERIRIADDASTAQISLRASGNVTPQTTPVSVVGSMVSENGAYRKAARDIQLTVSSAGGNAP